MSVHANLAGVFVAFVVGCNALTAQVRVDDTGTRAECEDGANGPVGETPCDGDEFVSPIGLPTGLVTIGEHVFNVEVAATHETRLRGLMERESLAADAGMLFIFDQSAIQSFWMFNTPLPLDIAFIREDLTISSTDTMEPMTTSQHVSIEPVLYALEVPAGEFTRRGIGAGDVISITLNE
jgi:uncharacterized membrane protein (UPF0127 family)